MLSSSSPQKTITRPFIGLQTELNLVRPTDSTRATPVNELTRYAVRLQRHFEQTSSPDTRKDIGHFGTPESIAYFMADLFTDIPNDVTILDPGAGTGVLSAALCDRILSEKSSRKIKIILYENQPDLAVLLDQVMNKTQSVMNEHGHDFGYEIHTIDFVLDKNRPQADLVIMNPPYFKIQKNSVHAKAMPHVVYGQPNIYALFMAAGAACLKDSGQFVSITPRSFCNGFYFLKFREYFLSQMLPYHIHLFESRTQAFRENKVLQENVVLAARKTHAAGDVTITTSNGRNLQSGGLSTHVVPGARVIDQSYGDHIIRISISEIEQKLMDFVESFKDRFEDMGFRISTGPIVTFRAKEFLIKSTNGVKAAPFLSMHNVRPFETTWPVVKNGKPTHCKICPGSSSLLLPSKNYILLKRFTSKEEKRRIVAGVFSPDQYSGQQVGLENHLNYLYKDNSELSPVEMYGLAALLNSRLYDRYFRSINGHTQVNAREIRALPLPALTTIRAIGQEVLDLPQIASQAIEDIVCNHLQIDTDIKRYLQEQL